MPLPDAPLSADRYARLRLIPWWRQDVLRAATVFVAGAGAVGNEVIKNLALVGIGRVIVLDKDHIELSNLTRSILFSQADVRSSKAQTAAARAQAINPDVTAIPIEADLAQVGIGWLDGVDVVISCFDSLYGRIILNRACARLGIPWINGGLGDQTDIFKATLSLYHAPDGPCFECALSPGMADAELQRQLGTGGCGATEQQAQALGAVPSTPTMASLLGALQVQEALRLLHAKAEQPQTSPPPAWGQFACYQAATHETFTLKQARNPRCPCHAPIRIKRVPGFTHNTPLVALWAQADLPSDAVLGLPAAIVSAIRCPACGPFENVWEYRLHDPVCPTCQQRVPVDHVWQFDATHPLAARSLAQIGMPSGTHLRWLAEEEITLLWSVADKLTEGHRP
jgi:molybdopterin/thiamine biosynthesis adenylyltransferase